MAIVKGENYSIIFDFYGDEEDLKKLHDAPMDYFDYESDVKYPDNYMVERWISGEFLLDYLGRLEKHEGVGDLMMVENLETGEKYEDWDEVRKLFKEFMRESSNLKVVKSQAEEPIAEEPTEKEFEMESMSDYDDIKFAIAWQDRIPTDEEMEVVRKHFINEGYEEEYFNIMIFGDFLDQLYDYIKSSAGILSDYIDEASMIHDRILNGELDLIKTSTGYVAVELYH